MIAQMWVPSEHTVRMARRSAPQYHTQNLAFQNGALSKYCTSVRVLANFSSPPNDILVHGLIIIHSVSPLELNKATIYSGASWHSFYWASTFSQNSIIRKIRQIIT